MHETHFNHHINGVGQMVVSYELDGGEVCLTDVNGLDPDVLKPWLRDSLLRKAEEHHAGQPGKWEELADAGVMAGKEAVCLTCGGR